MYVTVSNFVYSGNNTDGKYIEKAGKESFDLVETPLKITLFVEKDSKSKAITPIRNVVVKHISCGQNHTVVIDDRYRAFSWGFGGYGRLGHSETGNEMVPRLIKFLDGPKRGIRKIVAGGQFNLAVSEMPGTVYMWGQYVSNKEANMYPKPIHDLSGWMVRSIACNNKSWMIAADESVIGCCPSKFVFSRKIYKYETKSHLKVTSRLPGIVEPEVDKYLIFP